MSLDEGIGVTVTATMTRTVFITGVSSGIGQALAKAYLHEGAEVYGLSRRQPPDLLKDSNFRFKSVDLEKLDQIEYAIRELLKGVSNLNLAILNAGVLGKIADLIDTPLVQMQRVMNVNLWANKIVIDALFHLRIPVQQIVTMSSGAAVNLNRGWNAYAISKGALNTLTALYAAERPETHFSALAPGIVDTPMQDQIARMPQDPRFTSLELLRDAKGTPIMPPPDEASGRLLAAIDKATHYPSGSFLDANVLIKRALA